MSETQETFVLTMFVTLSVFSNADLGLRLYILFHAERGHFEASSRVGTSTSWCEMVEYSFQPQQHGPGRERACQPVIG